MSIAENLGYRYPIIINLRYDLCLLRDGKLITYKLLSEIFRYDLFINFILQRKILLTFALNLSICYISEFKAFLED